MGNRIILQEKRKAINRVAKKQQQDLYKEIYSKGVDKLEYEIAALENTIYHCKYDLNNSQKGNLIITSKMKYALQNLELKKKELNDLKNGNK